MHKIICSLKFPVHLGWNNKDIILRNSSIFFPSARKFINFFFFFFFFFAWLFFFFYFKKKILHGKSLLRVSKSNSESLRLQFATANTYVEILKVQWRKFEAALNLPRLVLTLCVSKCNDESLRLQCATRWESQSVMTKAWGYSLPHVESLKV